MDNEKELELDDNVVELIDDDGNVVNFYHVGTFDYKEETFVVFEPAEPNEDFEEGEAVIFKLEEDEEGNEVFTPIESEEKLQEVFDAFMAIEDECECEDGDCSNGGCSCGCDKH